MGGYAWVTLATNNSYSLGALVLAHSLKKANTAHKLVVLITPAVSQPMREQLQTVFDVVKVVDVLDSKDEAHLALMKRPDLGITFTKIHCWRLVEFEKCVFLDADTLVVRNCDELFEKEEFSAAPDASWPDCFNSGVFVYRPSVETFNKILQFAVENRSFDGGDQGLLNQFFSDWATEDIKKHLPFVYNLTSIAAYSYIPAFKHYGAETRIVHFIGTGKPWLQQLDAATRTVTPIPGSEHLAPLLQQWWDLFCEKVHPGLDKSLESNNDGMSHPPVEARSNFLPIALTDEPETGLAREPCTPYREKDDFRQHNLPYLPFHVKGPAGELLNVEFLTASVVPPAETPEGRREEGQRREENTPEGGNEPNGEETITECEIPTEENHNQPEEEPAVWERPPEVENYDESIEEEQQQQLEPPPPKDPFDYNSFFPDETCISSYLEKNVVTYQPFESPHSKANSEQPEEGSPSLPRFLTIPQNDQRQSGNTEVQPQHQDEIQSEQQQIEQPRREPTPVKEPTPPREEPEKRELSKSKSLSCFPRDVTEGETPPRRSIWKSQPDLNTDPNKRYSMPRLRPILPKQRSFSKSVPSEIPRVTSYTEFLISSEYKDPVDLPNDKIGFVETHIHKLRRSKSDADIRDRFGPLPYIPSPEMEKPVAPRKPPQRHFDNEYFDLSQCKRQLGNKPKPKDGNKKKETVHCLPALKPIVPGKDKKSTLIKKRKSKELSPGDGGKEKQAKREQKKVRERKRESIQTPRNVSTEGTGNNLDEILKRLREFSKDYQHFFGVGAKPWEKRVTCKNVTVQTNGDCAASEAFETVTTPVSNRTRDTQTPRKSVENSEFRQFRNYVKDKRETSQKGLMVLQDILSDGEGLKSWEDGATECRKECKPVRGSSEEEKERQGRQKTGAECQNDVTQASEGGEEGRKESKSGKVKPESSKHGNGSPRQPPARISSSEEEKDSQEREKTAADITQKAVTLSERQNDVTQASAAAEESKVVRRIPIGSSEYQKTEEDCSRLGENGSRETTANQKMEESSSQVFETNSREPTPQPIIDSPIQQEVKEERSFHPDNSRGVKQNERKSETVSSGSNALSENQITNENDSRETTLVYSKKLNSFLQQKIEGEGSVHSDNSSCDENVQQKERKPEERGVSLMVESENRKMGEESSSGVGQNDSRETLFEGEVQTENNRNDRDVDPKEKKTGERVVGEVVTQSENQKREVGQREATAQAVVESVILTTPLQQEIKFESSIRSHNNRSDGEVQLNSRTPEEKKAAVGTVPTTLSKVGEDYSTETTAQSVTDSVILMTPLQQEIEVESSIHSDNNRRSDGDVQQNDRKPAAFVRSVRITQGQNSSRDGNVIENDSRETGQSTVCDFPPQQKLNVDGTTPAETNRRKREVEQHKTKPPSAVGISTLQSPSTSSPGTVQKPQNEETRTKTESKKEGETDREKPKKPEEILCVPDFETPRTSRVSPPNGNVSRPHQKPQENGLRPNGDSPDGAVRVVGKKSAPPRTPCTPPCGNECVQERKTQSGIAGAIAQLSLEAGGQQTSQSAAATTAHEEYLRRQNWETGNMDYMGRDSFENIWSKICQTIEAKELEENAAGTSPQPQGKEKNTEAAAAAAPTAGIPVSLSSILGKCPEYIETLPGDPAAGPVEDDEIIFSKPDNRQSCLTNIVEEEEAGPEGSAAAVKLSDILKSPTASAASPAADSSPSATASTAAPGPPVAPAPAPATGTVSALVTPSTTTTASSPVSASASASVPTAVAAQVSAPASVPPAAPVPSSPSSVPATTPSSASVSSSTSASVSPSTATPSSVPASASFPVSSTTTAATVPASTPTTTPASGLAAVSATSPASIPPKTATLSSTPSSVAAPLPMSASSAATTAAPVPVSTPSSASAPTTTPVSVPSSAPAPVPATTPASAPPSTATPPLPPASLPAAAPLPVSSPGRTSTPVPASTLSAASTAAPSSAPASATTPSSVPSSAPAPVPFSSPATAAAPVVASTPTAAATPASLPSSAPAAIPVTTPASIPSSTTTTASATAPTPTPAVIPGSPATASTVPVSTSVSPSTTTASTPTAATTPVSIPPSSPAPTTASPLSPPTTPAPPGTVAPTSTPTPPVVPTPTQQKSPEAEITQKSPAGKETDKTLQQTSDLKDSPSSGQQPSDPLKPGAAPTETAPQPGKCTTVAILPPSQLQPAQGQTQQPQPDQKAQECKTVAIPLPSIFPGTTPREKDKKEEKGQVVAEPIPLPPPDTPSQEQVKTRSDSLKEEGKQKKGVFSKLLEMVGVAPKEKNGGDASKSVFYDVDGGAKGKQEGEKPEAKETGKPPEGETAGKVEEKMKETPGKLEEAVGEVKQLEEPKPGQPPFPKPARSVSPKEVRQPTDSIPLSTTRRSPSPKLTIPSKPPETEVTMPTPPLPPEAPRRKNSALLKVEETILQTPPVTETPKETIEDTMKGKITTEIDDIIGKAKSEVESMLLEGESSDSINAMKLMLGSDQPCKSQQEEVEELRVTSEEERRRHKGEVVTSKLSDQILKAIPPPRRKAISEATASTSAIPKPTAEQKSTAGGESKPKAGKPSAIPVPPPRNRGKPAPPAPAPSKPKGKK